MTAAFDAEMRKEGHFRIVIFGSARIHPDSPYYAQIHDLAKRIAGEGMDIVTGGGPGLMDAAASGHQEGNFQRRAHSIGLPIVLPTAGEHANQHLDIKKEFHRFSPRLDAFMRLANCVVIAPGGVGTMLEFMYTWQLIQVHFRHPIPIILLGDMWPELLAWVRKWQLRPGLLEQKDLDFIHTARNIDEAMELIRASHALFETLGHHPGAHLARYTHGGPHG